MPWCDHLHFNDTVIFFEIKSVPEVRKEAEGYDVEGFVTWNKKHFEGRTELRVFTPEGFLEVVDQSR